MPRSSPLSGPSDPSDDADDLLRCADVLGSFGVTAADVQSRRYGGESRGETDDLETALADELAAGRDRTAVLRQTITESERGLSCAARYARDALNRELTAVFDAIGWSFRCERIAAALRPADRLHLQASDYRGRQRETTVDYPDTPLGTDNLPAVLQAINASLLTGTDARFVLLSSGVDRWRAALVDEAALESLRDRYGPRISAVGRPLLPEHGLAAYVPEEPAASPGTAADGDGPWPDWAYEREREGTRTPGDEGGSLIEEAEGGSPPSAAAESSSTNSSSGTRSPTRAEAAARAPTETPAETPAATAATDGEFELRGSPSVSRVSGDGPDAEPGAAASEGEGRSRPELEASDRPSSGDDAADADATDTDDFGSLSGASTATRVSNDSFGSDVAWETETDRYRALGAALGAGGNVSVRGLLEDDDFLPELPATERSETRIEFSEEFDPAAVPRAKAAAEQSGFVWVESGSLETTRVSNS